MWFVYILECNNKSFYTGITNNLEKRFKAHREGRGGSYTRAFGARRMVYTEKLKTKSSALKREIEIKQCTRSEKLSLIKKHKNK